MRVQADTRSSTNLKRDANIVKIIHVNAQSIANKINQINLFLHTENPAFLCISEHWCRGEQLDTIVFDRYRVVASYVRTARIHGGSLIMARNDVVCSSVDYFAEASLELCIECSGITFKSGDKKCCLLAVYRSPSGCLNVFLDKLVAFLDRASRLADDVILCGDLNINYLIQNRDRDMFLDVVRSFNLTVTTNLPTRIVINSDDTTSATAIDYMLHNIDSANWSCEIKNPNLADHLSLVLTVDYGLDTSRDDMFTYRYRLTADNNIYQLRFMLSSEEWLKVYSAAGIDEAFQSFVDTYMWYIDMACPLITKKRTRVGRKNWITPEIVHESQSLRDLFYLVKSTNSGELQEVYRAKKKMHRHKLDCAKRNHNTNILRNSNNSTRKIWEIVRSETGKNMRKPVILNDSDGNALSAKLTVEAFGKYFSESAKDKMELYFAGGLSQSCTLDEPVPGSLFFYEISSHEVSVAIESLKNRNRAGINGVPTTLLKGSLEFILQPLQYLFNLSVDTGTFPSLLKKSLVIPIQKQSSGASVENYRPISLISEFSKILERIVFNRIGSFLDRCSALSDNQHGFRLGLSTATAACSFVDAIYKAIDNKLYTVGLFFDLTSAFDTVRHEFLLAKLHGLGVRGPLLRWLRSYLCGRVISVGLDGVVSDDYRVEYGVPQGSVLGPLLFIIFINDLPRCVDPDGLVMFADDTSMLVTSSSEEVLTTKVQRILAAFNEWCTANSLILNTNKSASIKFYKRRTINCDQFLFPNGDILRSMQNIKFLGVYLDEHLTWYKHIDHVCGKLNSAYYAILKLKPCLQTNYLVNVYYGLVHSILSYNTILWGNSTDSKRAFIQQKRVLRLIFNLKSDESCKPVFESERILPLPCIYIYECAMYIKKNLCGQSFGMHDYPTRYGYLIRTDQHRTACFERSPTYAGQIIYNKLPTDILSAPSESSFKTRLKLYLLRKCYYSVEDYLHEL